MINRRSFLSRFVPLRAKSELPDQLQTNSNLDPYTGTWGNPQMTHLLRRTMFGISKAHLQQLQGMTLDQAIDLILAVPTVTPDPPINHYATDDPDVPIGTTWTTAPFNALYEGQRRNSTKLWWLNLMRTPATPSIFEKMVLFWHNHLATEADMVGSAHLFYNHLLKLRQHTLGNFKQMVHDITIDPAMLRYLNGVQNTANSPDENYARELQELFTVGKGPDSQYTEADVQAAAKVLTGYRINFTTMSYFFLPAAHDTSNKQFSAFYNNTVIQGQTGAAGENELNDLLNMIFATQEVAKHVCRKLYRFFVYYDITEQIETDIITPLADIFRNNNYDILPVLSALFRSQHFFDSYYSDCIIKNPLDFFVGLCREMQVPFPTDLVLTYQANERIRTQCTNLQLNVGDPPSVSGWPAYYQTPSFHELWINTDTFSKRMEIGSNMCNNGYQIVTGLRLKIDHVAFAQTFDNPLDPNALVNEAVLLLYSYDVDQTFKDYLKTFLLSGQTSDYYWSDAWAEYTSNPTDTTAYNTVNSRLKAMFEYMLTQAEYHLC
jgi:hypothetical protein